MIKGTPKELIKKLLELDQEKIYELKEYREKRTLNQNSYYHSLLNQLAVKLRIPAEELHFEMIKKSCPFEEYLIIEEATLRGLEYYEIRGRIKRDDKIYKIVRVHVGSSKLNTSEMGILLDSLIEECKLQGINTLTPAELAKMRALEER